MSDSQADGIAFMSGTSDNSVSGNVVTSTTGDDGISVDFTKATRLQTRETPLVMANLVVVTLAVMLAVMEGMVEGSKTVCLLVFSDCSTRVRRSFKY